MKYYNLGDKLIEEGSEITHFYLIRSGEVKLVSSTNPAHLAVSNQGHLGLSR